VVDVGSQVNISQLSVVHRLPQAYRWSAGYTGSKVEAIPEVELAHDNNLVGLKLLSEEGGAASQVMQVLMQVLQEIQVESVIVEWEGQPCLFVHNYDESATLCRLKNVGMAIAEQHNGQYSD